MPTYRLDLRIRRHPLPRLAGAAKRALRGRRAEAGRRRRGRRRRRARRRRPHRRRRPRAPSGRAPAAASAVDPRRFRLAINDALPHDVHVLAMRQAPDRFHARHDAVLRSYVYQISRRRTALAKRNVWWIKRPLDPGADRAGRGRAFRGCTTSRHFCERPQDQTSTRVLVERAEVAGDGALILVRLAASHFLWKMVRRVVGTLVRVGAGELAERDFEALVRGGGDARRLDRRVDGAAVGPLPRARALRRRSAAARRSAPWSRFRRSREAVRSAFERQLRVILRPASSARGRPARASVGFRSRRGPRSRRGGRGTARDREKRVEVERLAGFRRRRGATSRAPDRARTSGPRGARTPTRSKTPGSRAPSASSPGNPSRSTIVAGDRHAHRGRERVVDEPRDLVEREGLTRRRAEHRAEGADRVVDAVDERGLFVGERLPFRLVTRRSSPRQTRARSGFDLEVIVELLHRGGVAPRGSR